MTENESLTATLQNAIECATDDITKEDLEMMVKCLEELQQYRAIGTVEGYERAIASSIENYNLYREYKAKVQEFEAIGTIEEFKALKEKNEPKEMDRYYCPICRHYFEDTDAYNYCPICGQKMKPIWQ